MGIYLTHPGIAFHLVMFLFGHNAWLMVLGSMVVGYGMWWVYNYVLTQISRFLNDNDDDNDNEGGSDAAFFVFERQFPEIYRKSSHQFSIDKQKLGRN